MIKEIVKKAKQENRKVYVYAHKFPDGDAISSSCAVVEYLKKQGIDAIYVVRNQVWSYKQIVGDIPVTSSVDKDGISIILDTNTVSYAENTLFKNSTLENIYVIDHHAKAKGSICIEDDLHISKKNVIRDSDASSVCEILVNELDKEKITPQIADMLILGLLTDTAKLKFLKPNTLKSLSELMNLGANYQKVIESCTRKIRLQDEVGIATTLLKTRTFQIGDTFGMILGMDNREVKELDSKYRVRNPQKKIFKMSDIKDCSFMCMYTENFPGEYNAEFRSTTVCGNFNVLELATSHGGGGHYNASGCSIKSKDRTKIENDIKSQALKLYEGQAVDIPEVILNEQDMRLSQILDDTCRLTKGVTPEIISEVDFLVKAGANYDYVFKVFKSFKQFMLENEILSRVPYSVYSQRTPFVSVALSRKDIDLLTRRYDVSEDEILSSISAFSNVDIKSAQISLPNGRKVIMNSNGDIIEKDSSEERI